MKGFRFHNKFGVSSEKGSSKPSQNIDPRLLSDFHEIMKYREKFFSVAVSHFRDAEFTDKRPKKYHEKVEVFACLQYLIHSVLKKNTDLMSLTSEASEHEVFAALKGQKITVVARQKLEKVLESFVSHFSSQLENISSNEALWEPSKGHFEGIVPLTSHQVGQIEGRHLGYFRGYIAEKHLKEKWTIEYIRKYFRGNIKDVRLTSHLHYMLNLEGDFQNTEAYAKEGDDVFEQPFEKKKKRRKK